MAVRETLWRLVVSTTGTCMRNRVTGLAAEAAFFAVLSLPPLIFALAGSIGYVFARFSATRVENIRGSILDLAGQALTPETVDTIIRPTLDDVLSGGRYDVVSIGFVLALWSGSRALNVFVDTITIMYGLGGHRGIVQTRVLSFFLYALGLVIGIVAIPLVLAGPTIVGEVIPDRLGFLASLYWPVVVVLSVCFLSTLYHVSVPVRTRWRYNLPGAFFTMFCWITGSLLLRIVLTGTAGQSTSIYGPLAAPIAILIWLYLLAITVLIGAALNASLDQLWPQSETAAARLALVRKLRIDALVNRRAAVDAERSAAAEIEDLEVAEEQAERQGDHAAEHSEAEVGRHAATVPEEQPAPAPRPEQAPEEGSDHRNARAAGASQS